MGGGAVTIDEKISHNVSDSLTICVPVEIVVAVSLNFYHLRRNTVQNEENFSSIVACVVRPFTPWDPTTVYNFYFYNCKLNF